MFKNRVIFKHVSDRLFVMFNINWSFIGLGMAFTLLTESSMGFHYHFDLLPFHIEVIYSPPSYLWRDNLDT